MPTFTNKHGLPDPLFQLLGRESYSRGKSRRSATQLIDSPRLVVLKEHHQDRDTQEVDVSDRIWALFGTAVHKLVEEGLPHSNWNLVEERIFTEVNGWTISGAIDLQENENRNTLIDWKVCAVWAAKQDPPKSEWVRQLNLLAYLVEKTKGIEVHGLQIGAFIRDWKSSEARRTRGYPRAPVQMIDIPLWSFEEREAYVLERVKLHQEAEMAITFGDEPEPCTDEEMWVKGNQYAVIKTGNVKATKVFDNQAEADAFCATLPSATVEFRPGLRERCVRWCEAAAFCSLAPKPESDPFDI